MMEMFLPARIRRFVMPYAWVVGLLVPGCLLGVFAGGAAANEPAAASPASSEDATGDEGRSAELAISFERDVRPILKAACFHCHGEAGELNGGLDVRLVRLMVEGGHGGEAVVPGDAEASLLFQRVRDGEMPPDAGHGLDDDQVALIGRWIDAGARTLRPEPETLDGPLITAEDLAHWSLQPIRRPAVPAVDSPRSVTNPIDAFVLAKLEAEGLDFSPPAPGDRLARRLAIDLWGLPPSPEMIASLSGDGSRGNYRRWVDRLLASPRYGERWGRHWLDVAGYADSEGYSVDDAERKHAWRYRDYVIDSWNDDKPFDKFVVEQIAGDELVTSPIDDLAPEDAERLIATGFLRMAPDGTGGKVDDAGIARNETIARTVEIVSSSLMGMTVACAQCHDHRYDPIPHTDYYRLRAIFDPALDWKDWKSPAQRAVSLYTSEDRAKAAEIEAEAKKILSERSVKQKEFIAATFEKELAKLPEEIHDAARAAYETPSKERTDEQKALLKKHPSLNVSAGSLYLYDRKAADELKRLAAEAEKIRSRKPEEHFVRALVEPPESEAESFLFDRGDHEQPKEPLEPGGLTAVSMNAEGLPGIPVDDAGRSTTGRRLAFARRLSHPDHPLTARVIVNRVWMHHFGRGLVPTPADFGMLGEPPTHPELLDWLASELIDSGWSVKHLHRLILSSTTFRQDLRTDPRHQEADPDNALFGGARLRRLDAEAVRDVALATSGKLVHELGGPPVPVMADRVGRWVLGVENLNAGRPGDVIPLGRREFRRSVYVQARRSRPVAVLDTFDWPRMDPNCDRRRASTVATQSLMLMNSDFVVDVADDFAERVIREAGGEASRQVARVWQIAYGRVPDETEASAAESFLRGQRGALESAEDVSAEDAAEKALSTLCQTVLSSNAFLYVD